MKTMYEHLDKLDICKWHQEKKNYFEYTLRGYYDCYQTVYHIFLKIVYHLNDFKTSSEYLEETSEFLNHMIVQNSV